MAFTNLATSFFNILPISGLYGGVGLTLAFIALKNLYVLALGAKMVLPITWYLPTLCASAYWTRVRLLISFLIPVLCATLFIMHPVGAHASVYTLFWLIPVLTYWASERSLLLHALGSSFIAHAVGSVMWLYMVPTTAEYWVALMPKVCVERLLMALSMVFVVYALRYFGHIAYITYVAIKRFLKTRKYIYSRSF